MNIQLSCQYIGTVYLAPDLRQFLHFFDFLLAVLRREMQLQGNLYDPSGIQNMRLVHMQLAFFVVRCFEYKSVSLCNVTHSVRLKCPTIVI